MIDIIADKTMRVSDRTLCLLKRFSKETERDIYENERKALRRPKQSAAVAEDPRQSNAWHFGVGAPQTMTWPAPTVRPRARVCVSPQFLIKVN